MRASAIQLLILALAASAGARPRSYDAAVSVLGQADFAAEIAANPPTDRSFDNADGVALDPTTGKLFVADSENHRILRFAAADAYKTNAAAEAVFGQADFASREPNRGQPGASADSLFNPSSLCCDAQGRLWVCDFNNARVLRFDGASLKPSGTASADGVIGQPDFATRTAATRQVADGGFENPGGIAIDAQGNLWVADLSIPKVTRFDDAAALGAAYDGASDAYFGKVEAGEFAVATSAEGFGSGPGGISLDAQGRLWVSDPTNNRVLRFDGALAKSSGAGADGVLGQPDLDSNDFTAPPTASTFSGPYSVTAAPDGTVWVSDFVNNRVLGFVEAASKEDGGDADIVLGQPDFASDADLPNSARTAKSPSQIAIGREGSLFIAQFRLEGLVKRWSDPVTITAPGTARASAAGVATVRGTASGGVRVEYQVAGRGGFKAAKGTAKAWSVRLTKLKRKVTRVVVRSVAFDGRVAAARIAVRKPR